MAPNTESLTRPDDHGAGQHPAWRTSRAVGRFAVDKRLYGMVGPQSLGNPMGIVSHRALRPVEVE